MAEQPGSVPVRVKMWPDRDHHVRPDEVEPLRRQGLLIEDQDAKPDGARASGGRAAATSGQGREGGAA